MDVKERLFSQIQFDITIVVLHFEAFITERKGLTKICNKVSGFDLLVPHIISAGGPPTL